MDAVNDAKLLTIAAERIEKFDSTNVISSEEMDSRPDISEADLTGFDEVEFE